MIIRAFTERGQDGLGVECRTSAESHTKLAGHPEMEQALYRDLRAVIEKHINLLHAVESEQTHFGIKELVI